MAEYAFGLVSDDQQESKNLLVHLLRCGIRILWVVVLIAAAIMAPDLGIVMAFMGSAMCFTIAIILPLLFYLRIFAPKLSVAKKLLLVVLLVASSVAASVGTVWACGIGSK
jgi:solute carrier family 32 (vesicular inhibitory amino acid transporter)